MGLNFRKSVKMGPVRVNFSKSGVGYSVGGKGFRVTKKANGGTRTTVGIPGTGISYSTDSKRKSPSGKTCSNQSKRNNTGAEYAYSADSSRGKGCSSGCLVFAIIIFAVALAAMNWKWFLIVAGMALLAFLGRNMNLSGMNPPIPNEISNNSDDPQMATPILPAETVKRTEKDIDSPLQQKIRQFEKEIEDIPKVEVHLSAPVSRQLLKNIPEYTFSNITRTTRLDSIFPLVFIDVETTGFAPSKCEILEVSAVKFESGMKPVSAFTTLCRPNKPIPQDASAINHITDAMVEEAPAFAQIAPGLSDFLNGCHVAGHNLDFDLRFIFAHGAKLPENVRFYDTLDLAHLTIPKGSILNYKLDTICDYYGIWRNNAHRSLSDAYATAKIFSHLVQDKTSRNLNANLE